MNDSKGTMNDNKGTIKDIKSSKATINHFISCSEDGYVKISDMSKL